MAECIDCGAYTKFNGGRCLPCYKKENVTNDSKAKDIKPVKKESKLKNAKEKKRTDNPWISGVIKGRIAETIVEELFLSLIHI